MATWQLRRRDISKKSGEGGNAVQKACARTASGPQGRQCGTTLVEQIMVLVIIASLATVATPSLGKWLARNRLGAARSELIGALQDARAAAISSGRQTLVCPSTDGARCSPNLRWEGGWLQARDADRDSQPDGVPVHVGSRYGGRLAIRSSNGRQLVRFHPDGSAGGSNLTLLFCSPGDPDSALTVVLANSGRVRAAPATPTQATMCAQLH